MVYKWWFGGTPLSGNHHIKLLWIYFGYSSWWLRKITGKEHWFFLSVASVCHPHFWSVGLPPYSIFSYMYPINDPNAGKYTIHGSSGKEIVFAIATSCLSTILWKNIIHHSQETSPCTRELGEGQAAMAPRGDLLRVKKNHRFHTKIYIGVYGWEIYDIYGSFVFL